MGFIKDLIEKLIGKKKQKEIDLKCYEENSAEIDRVISHKLKNLNAYSDNLLNSEDFQAFRDRELQELRGRETELLYFVDDVDYCKTISDVIKFIRLSAIFRVKCEDIIQKEDIEKLKELHKDARQILIHAVLKYGIYKNKSEISWDGICFDLGGPMSNEEKKYMGLAYLLMRINSHVNEPTKKYSFDLKLTLSKLKVARLCRLSESQYLFI